jgi:hypothetical protein
MIFVPNIYNNTTKFDKNNTVKKSNPYGVAFFVICEKGTIFIFPFFCRLRGQQHRQQQHRQQHQAH